MTIIIDGLYEVPKVGDGMTLHIYTDAYAYTVIHVSESGRMLTLQRDFAIRTNRDDDIIEPGGFVAHNEYPKGQQYKYAPDPDGQIIKASFRAKGGKYKKCGSPTKSPGFWLSKGRNEWFDYNF